MFPIGDENERGAGPPLVTIALIIANVLVFLYQRMPGIEALQDFVTTYGVIPVDRERPGPLHAVHAIDVRTVAWRTSAANTLFL